MRTSAHRRLARRIVEDAILARLTDQPTTPTRAIRRRRPNPLAELGLRVGDFRVLFYIAEDAVVILVVGRKAGDARVVAGEVFHGHQDDPAEPARG